MVTTMIQDHRVSHRQACVEVGISRSSYYYQDKLKDDAEQQEIMGSHFTDTPEQRYLKLPDSRPDLFQRIL